MRRVSLISDPSLTPSLHGCPINSISYYSYSQPSRYCTDYVFPNTCFIPTVKGLKEGKCASRRQKELRAEDGRGEWQRAGRPYPNN
jgi:hypothetical protein